MIGPPDVIKAATNLQSHLTSNVANVSQRAALAARRPAASTTSPRCARRSTGGGQTMHTLLNGIDGRHLPRARRARSTRSPRSTGVLGRDLGGHTAVDHARARRRDPRRGQGGGRARRGVRRAGLRPAVVRARRRRPRRGRAAASPTSSADERAVRDRAARRTGPGRRRSPPSLLVEGAASAQRAARSTATTSGGPRAARRGRPHPARPAGRRRRAARRPARRLERPHPGARVRRRRVVACATACVWFVELGRPAALPPRRRRRPRRSRSRSRRTRSRPGPCATPTADLSAGRALAGVRAGAARRRAPRRQRDRRAAGVAGEDVGEPSTGRPGHRPRLRRRRPASAPTAPGWRGCSGTTPTCRGTAPSCASARRSTPTAGAADAELVAGRPRRSRSIQPDVDRRRRPARSSSDRTGWWNLYRFDRRPTACSTSPSALAPIDAEIGGAARGSSASRGYALLPDDGRGGRRLERRRAPSTSASSRPARGPVERLATCRTPRSASCAVGADDDRGGRAPATGHESAVVALPLGAPRAPLATEVLRARPRPRARPGAVLRARADRRSRPAGGRDRPRALLPADQPRRRRRPPGERPPLLVLSHGGPTVGGPPDRSASAPSSGPAGASPSSTSTTAARTGYGRAVPRRGSTALGHRRRRRLRRRGPAPRRPRASSTASGWPSGAAAPAATRRCAALALPRHVRAPAPATTASPTSRRWPATPTSSSPATSTA